jgi:glycosyltransferase involved in cell wall biosynthesis
MEAKRFAIVIPCRNEEKYIGKCLDSIIALDYDKSLLEVFVCDGHSSDRTQEIVRAYEQMHPFIKLLINDHRTTPYALNLGIRNSTSDIVIILGAHAELYPDYLVNSLQAFSVDPQIGCVGGIIENVMEDDTSEVISCAMSSSFGVGNAHFRTGGKEGYVDTVAFGAYRREVFDKIGLFDDELARNQDDEFNYRVIKAGYKIWLAKNIRSKYYVRAAFDKLYKQYYQYGYWKVYVNTKHRTVTTGRQLVPLFFVLYLIGGALLSLLSKYIFFAYIAVLLLYFLLAAFAASRVAKKISHVPQIVFAFLIVHWSYGYGYLLGIIDFVIRKRKPGGKASVLTR